MVDKNKYLYPLAIMAVVTLACFPQILMGVQSGHSLRLNISWTTGFTGQLLGGELYPRWLVDMNDGLGSPVFFFYGPLPFYLMAPTALFCPDCSANIVVGITGWLIVALSGLAFYVFARQHAAPLASTIGSVLYAIMPYHFFIDLLVRQALGEVAAYIWMPLILYFTRKMASDRYSVIGFAFSYSFLILSHLPSALLFSMFLLVYAAISAYQNRSIGHFNVFASGVLLGIALAGIYLVPALFSQDYISADQWVRPDFQYHQWFFLDGIAAPNPLFDSGLFPLLLVSTLVFFAAGYIAFRQREGHERLSLLPWLLFVVGAWFLMTPVSRFLWELLPFLQKVQFPWRVAIMLDLSVAITIVMALRDIPMGLNWRFASISTMAALLLLLSGGLVAQFFAGDWKLSKNAKHQELIQTVISTGYDAQEYIPASVRLSQEEVLAHLKSTPKVGFDADKGQVGVVRWEARKIALDVDLSAETRLTVRQFHYPDWRATIVGSGADVPVGPSNPAGLLELTAPPGQYSLELELTRSWQELAGGLTSGAGLLIVMLLAAARALHRRQVTALASQV